MIRLAGTFPELEPGARYGLDVLLDASRLLRVDDPTADVVVLDVLARRGPAPHGTTLAPRFEVRDGVVTVGGDVLHAIVDLAGAAVEQRSAARDRYGRIPASVNPLVGAGREREPIVSAWGRALAGAVTAAAGRRAVWRVPSWPEGRRWAVALTHDLDVVAGWPAFTALRVVELLRAGEIAQAAAVSRAALAAVGRDPVGAAVRAVLVTEAQAGVRSTWFVLCGRPTPRSWARGDVTYRIDGPRARGIVRAVLDGGHEVGLHGSFATMDEAGRFTDERARLAHLWGTEVAGVRQHFLRMRPGATHRAMTQAGFTYDASFGFSDRNGFRLGVADVVPGWDEARGTPAGIREVPLIWMDRAMSKYANVHQPERWVADALELAAACREVEGLWVGLWHPNLSTPLGFPGAEQAYRDLVASLVSHRPFTADLTTMGAWCRARGGLRAARVGSEGRVALAASTPWSGTVALEGPDGRTGPTCPWPGHSPPSGA